MVTALPAVAVVANGFSALDVAHRDAPAARDCPATISTTPASPRPGSLFIVRITNAAPNLSFTGTAASEPLHFNPSPSGEQQALAAIPIDSTTSLGVTVICAGPSATDTVLVRVKPTPGAYAIEKLRVAPKFGEQPDSALADRLRLEARRAADVSLLAHDTPRLWHLPFVAPRASRITSKFGGGREFNGTITSRHMGLDFAGATGAEIRATNRGVVRLVDSFFLGGNVVYIDHGEGLVTAYLHQSKTLVAVGDTVERGSVIGRVGATGRVTGPHLHFIARYGGISVDPQSLLSLLGPPTSTKATPVKSATTKRRKRS